MRPLRAQLKQQRGMGGVLLHAEKQPFRPEVYEMNCFITTELHTYLRAHEFVNYMPSGSPTIS